MRFALCAASPARDGTEGRQAQSASTTARRSCARGAFECMARLLAAFEDEIDDGSANRPADSAAGRVLEDVAENGFEALDSVAVVMLFGSDGECLSAARLHFVDICHVSFLARVDGKDFVTLPRIRLPKDPAFVRCKRMCPFQTSSSASAQGTPNRPAHPQ